MHGKEDSLQLNQSLHFQVYLQPFLSSYHLYLKNLIQKFILSLLGSLFSVLNEVVVFFNNLLPNLTSAVSVLQSVISCSEATVRNNFPNAHFLM